MRALLVLALLLFARTARADNPPSSSLAGVQLSWVRGPGAQTCPDRSALARDVARRLGRDPFTGEPTRWLEATVSHEVTRWRVNIYVRDSSGTLLGERELSSDTPQCDTVAAAASLALAIAIDPDAALRAPPTPSTPAPAFVPAPPALPPPPAPAVVLARPPETTTLPTVAVVAPPPRRETPPPPTNALRPGSVALRFAGSLGTLPVFAPGVEIESTAVSLAWFRASVGVFYLPEVRTTTPDNHFAFGLTAAWLRGCATVVHGARAELLGCGGAMLGAVHSVVYVRLPTGPGDRAWFALSAGLRARVRVLGPLSLEASLEALVPVTRYEFYIEGSGTTVFTQPVVGGVGQVGASLSIW